MILLEKINLVVIVRREVSGMALKQEYLNEIKGNWRKCMGIECSRRFISIKNY